MAICACHGGCVYHSLILKTDMLISEMCPLGSNASLYYEVRKCWAKFNSLLHAHVLENAPHCEHQASSLWMDAGIGRCVYVWSPRGIL